MKLADRIRQYVLLNHIEPARQAGRTIVDVRVGDVHSSMGRQSRLPAVASALGANVFEDYARVRLVRREGPHMGANLVLAYKIL